MNGIILLLLIIGILYIALTYFKGPRNTYTNTDGFITRPFDSGTEENEDLPPELESGEEDFEVEEAEESADTEGIDEVEEDDTDEEGDDVDASDSNAAKVNPINIPVNIAQSNTEVLIDTEVHVDTPMSSGAEAASKQNQKK